MQELEEQYQLARWISDELLNRISPGDSRKLENWKNDSQDHRREYLEIRLRLKTDLRERGEVDLEQEWRYMQKSLSRRKKRLPGFWYAAAVVVIGLFLTVTIRQRQPVIPEPANEVCCGQKTYKALLILENGEKVVIGDSVRKNIPLEKGMIVDSANLLKYKVQAQEKGPVKWNTIVVPRGAEYEMCLADGTRIWLNSESRLTYPVCFNGKERRVEMQGEICFQVARDEQKPFVVKTGETAVTVLGTLFNVEAYPENGQVVTTLVEGKVRVEHQGDQYTLIPNRQAIVEQEVLTVKEVVARDYVSWVNGYFHFTEASLGEIMVKLARWYDVEFFFVRPELENVHFFIGYPEV